MAKISLRAYNREIEALIEQGSNDEAIAHCRHILKTFPKCLDTYRLLGKGYLEARRFTEAEDILRRLLLAVPDDFIGNLGMSIVFDEQKNINNAVWHMERAFEVQPSNTAIQGELRRLYGRRDGLEPPQIRLTRGALAQMYVRGSQIPQAIAEIRAMLAEDSDRMDLQVLLARAYYRGGLRVEATDTCTALLKKYPYCLDANRIMVEILTDATRSDSKQIYRHRVNALDPYSAFVTGSLFAVGDVPDAAVSLDQLDIDASEYAPETDLGFDSMAKTALGLSLVSEGAQASGEEGAGSPQPTEPAAAPAEEIPEWLRVAGWGATTAEAVRRAELAAHEEDIETDASTQAVEELAQGEVPDWLKSMAPPEAAQAPEPDAGVGELESAEADTDWLAGLGMPERGEIESSSEMTKAGMGLTGAAGAAAAGTMLAKRDEEEEIFAEEAESERPAPASDSGASLMEEPTPSSGEDELPDWLQETVAAGPASDAEAPSEVLPDWLTGSGAEQAQPASEPDASGLAPLGPAAAAAAMAASLGGERAQPQEQPEGENETLAGEPASDLSNWLASLDQEDEAKVQEPAQAGGETQIAETALEAGMAVETAGETPAEAAPQSALQDGEAALEAPAMAGSPRAGEVTPEDVAQMSEDDAFAWLESLAAKQGVDPNQLLTRPEEPSETTPEWLSQPEIDRNTETPGSAATIFAAAAVGEMLSPEDEPAEAAPEPQKAEASGAGDMDWLEGIEQEKITGELEAQTPMASEWLPMESAAEGAAPSVPELPREENGEEDAPPLASEPTAEESADAESPTQPQAEEEMPDWMRTSLEETPSRPMEEGVPEWMKASDEAQPSAEEEAETSVLEAEVAAAESSPAGPESGIEIARRTPPEEDDAIFEQAQIDLQRGDLEQATLGYKRLIRKGKLLDEVIFELREGTYQHPVDVVIWLTLGDAYRRANRLQEALDAYTKAEELLR